MKQKRLKMVERQIEARGVRDQNVLEAFRKVPRHEFVPEGLQEHAYDDAPLPIEENQTISQPYIVAAMTEALELTPESKVLEIGTGSGYAAAILAHIADEVYTIERHKSLAETAQKRFDRLDYDNVHVLHADGTLGWDEEAPFDAIVAAASGPEPPQPLLKQLANGGRMVIPIGDQIFGQELVRIRRSGDDYTTEKLGGVRFVPLIGEAGWDGKGRHKKERKRGLPEDISEEAEPFEEIANADLDALLDRIGDSRLVLIGEATHGTSEFYRLRARITQELIERKGFRIVAVEADWPDAASVDRYVKGQPDSHPPKVPFARFPRWMWANDEVAEFARWLKQYNEDIEKPAGFYGLDLYSLFTSIEAVLHYLDEVDPDAAEVARIRYGCLTPYSDDAASYGAAVLSGKYRKCEGAVLGTLNDLLERRLEYGESDGDRLFDAEQNARSIAGAERYYREMYYGGRTAWNLRDQHMFDTLGELLNREGPESRAVVWAHNSHLGDASATAMGASGEHNLGQLCRRHFGEDAYLIGMGTDHGTVAAASHWGGELELKNVRPAIEESYEGQCHQTDIERFFLPMRAASSGLRKALSRERLERAIGVIYLPKTERQSHYFHAVLPRQFDEWIWFDETKAVTPIDREPGREPAETFPFAL